MRLWSEESRFEASVSKFEINLADCWDRFVKEDKVSIRDSAVRCKVSWASSRRRMRFEAVRDVVLSRVVSSCFAVAS